MAGKKSSGRDSTSANAWAKAGSSRPPRRQLPVGRSPIFEAWLAAYRRKLGEICEEVSATEASPSEVLDRTR
jgi:hypothetical protein